MIFVELRAKALERASSFELETNREKTPRQWKHPKEGIFNITRPQPELV
ncbi:MAG: hypothetical protein K9M45_13910 [Kiritimatiellales bacterium]|nr:hypothetical protein [Kiritimatiellales bacterium]